MCMQQSHVSLQGNQVHETHNTLHSPAYSKTYITMCLRDAVTCIVMLCRRGWRVKWEQMYVASVPYTGLSLCEYNSGIHVLT